MIIRSKKPPGLLRQYRIFPFSFSSANVKSCHIQESCTTMISFGKGRWTDTDKIYLTLKIYEHSLLSSAITEHGESAEEIPSEA